MTDLSRHTEANDRSFSSCGMTDPCGHPARYCVCKGVMKGRVLAYLRDFGPKTHVAIANHVGDKPGEYGHLAAGSDVSEALAFLVTDGSVKPPYSNTKGNLMWEAVRSEVTT